MKMAAFEYHRPTSVAEALALLAEYGADAKVLAGGQSLVPMLAMRLSTPVHLVDITRVAGLDEIGLTAGGDLEVGATVRHSAAETSSIVRETTPLLARALPWIGHRAIRNRGTVCGSLAHADSAAELPAVALALGATLVLQSASATREVAAADFFTGYLGTVIAEDELLTHARFPAAPPRSGAAVVEIARRHGDFAVVGAACSVHVDDDGAIADAALAFFGVAGTAVRIGEAEAMLRGARPSATLLERVAAVVSSALHPPGDAHGTAAYRRHIAGVLTRRGLTAALSDAGIGVEVAA